MASDQCDSERNALLDISRFEFVISNGNTSHAGYINGTTRAPQNHLPPLDCPGILSAAPIFGDVRCRPSHCPTDHASLSGGFMVTEHPGSRCEIVYNCTLEAVGAADGTSLRGRESSVVRFALHSNHRFFSNIVFASLEGWTEGTYLVGIDLHVSGVRMADAVVSSSSDASSSSGPATRAYISHARARAITSSTRPAAGDAFVQRFTISTITFWVDPLFWLTVVGALVMAVCAAVLLLLCAFGAVSVSRKWASSTSTPGIGQQQQQHYITRRGKGDEPAWQKLNDNDYDPSSTRENKH